MILFISPSIINPSFRHSLIHSLDFVRRFGEASLLPFLHSQQPSLKLMLPVLFVPALASINHWSPSLARSSTISIGVGASLQCFLVVWMRLSAGWFARKQNSSTSLGGFSFLVCR
ncbi:hypothetical protein BDV27DRAFT_127954 [Aspergillus caelatus]|uniref:Uncharacterized protein n=1 Tax=Aspergillus caelatus TaxID=61420 RepID=A0A5N7A6P1_9EURO|nr:uncharacterized protein BDV27DRAFT_127954 [Aspergillus caelatus]KAE8364769.1 hypothetical protein BDV27DRAFT_127954 [Aspergillus caelatus]